MMGMLSVLFMLECRTLQSYIYRNPQALFTPDKVHNTYHQYLADHGCKPMDSCLFHQKLYHYHRRSRKHHLAKGKKCNILEITEYIMC